MPQIQFPPPLQELLKDSPLQGPIRTLADRIGVILDDNKLPFFPDYTDHGTDHINSVLKSMVDLVPKDVWDKSKADSSPRLLVDADAAVIIGSALLHDIAMHLRETGFLELVSKDSRFHPLPWFKEQHTDHTADRPWHDLWEDYQREARRFSQRDLTGLIGEESAASWAFDKLPAAVGQWERNHHLIIGEFLRRHHARLAHEIAIYGFPGLPVGAGAAQFPAMGTGDGHLLKEYADLIGLTARSHGTSLRVCLDYLRTCGHYGNTPRPMGSAVLYPMALLRVADYLQMDSRRAPAVLLTLRNPPSPVSVMEWNKHGAVQHIGPGNDPRSKSVTVKPDITLPVYLELQKLLTGLQQEIDRSTAVLDEAYGTLTHLGLHELGLSIRRVHSSLDDPAFRARLPYVPRPTGFSADPNILTLLVEPLYGKNPGVGIRELMQNAVDAVCERKAWHEKHGTPPGTEVTDEGWDVLIEYIKRDDGSWYVRVTDKGIGMTSDTIEKYFLRAGASYRRSPEWAKEFLDENGKHRVTRAGRFGIGAFAVFLLGKSFKLSTRHITAPPYSGHSIEVSENSQLIEIRRDLPSTLAVGTTLEAELSPESVQALWLEADEYEYYHDPRHQVDWFCWDWPHVAQKVLRRGEAIVLSQGHTQPIRGGELPPEWSVIDAQGFDAVYWTYAEARELSCNGLSIGESTHYLIDEAALIGKAGFEWPAEEWGLSSPKIAVMDSSANLPLTTQRFGLSQWNLPFAEALCRDVAASFIAHALVCGPSARAEVLLPGGGHPLRVPQVSAYELDQDQRSSPFAFGRLRWCATATEYVPCDPWLYALLRPASCFVVGSLTRAAKGRALSLDVEEFVPGSAAMIRWQGRLEQEERRMEVDILGSLVKGGIAALGHVLVASHVWVSTAQAAFQAAQVWTCVKAGLGGRALFQKGKGRLSSPLPPQSIEDRMSATLGASHQETIFVAQLETRPPAQVNKSYLATLWEEYLGPYAIPFDADNRQQMIEDARGKHPELRRHIEAWEKKKRAGTERSHSPEE